MNAPQTIVIAEDSRFQGRVLKTALEAAGYVVHWGTTGTQALALIREHEPVLVVSDVEMPEMDGHELCRILKADAGLRHIPVLMLTALAATSDILKGLREGAAAYVTKPYDPPHILDRIEHLLRHLSAPDTPGEPLPLEYGGETMQLDVSRRQLLNLLLSTYENILQQNTKLEEMHSQLQTASQQLGESLQKTQDLLYRVFPRQIADELANAGQSQPRHFDAVTVLFTDFVGFTRVAETMAPQQLIDGLEEYFRRFDALTATCHMEKLKTIGDAYVAAGGVPTANTTHALDAALLSLAIRECVKETSLELAGSGMPSFAIRIGLHTGPLVAGVIGEQRFTYDLWGDTVNTASRMESGGEAGRINISDATFRLVEPFFECSPRGSIAVKNRTAVEMYFLERLRPEYSADPAGLTPNERFQQAREQLQNAVAPPT
jgi:class 3 adenylate cyclase/DNA-binding response OmpR family regulator